MNDKQSIDIVLPTFRLDENVLLTIINLPRPTDFNVHIYVVVDNPQVRVPNSLDKLHQSGAITLIINPENLGVSASRNKGILAGKSKWIVLLDDDIQPRKDLLAAYASAILGHPNAIGFAGVTYFPPPFNAVTKALVLNGSISHFRAASDHDFLIWAPTANLMLNRQKMNEGLFDATLTKSGEDIDFLVRNCLQFRERYVGVPEAVVVHPWWDNGRVQTKRMIRYGEGASQIAGKEPVKSYTYRDFTNTSESILLLIILVLIALVVGLGHVILWLFVALIVSEFATNWLKGIRKGGSWSINVALQMMWMKNCYEMGYLVNSLTNGRISGFAERIELGFAKPHPSPFRLNKWKIIKSILLILLVILFLSIT